MSEPMLTRGQLLNLMKEAPDEYPQWIWEKLVTMALASIAMREALAWYELHVGNCNKVHGEGEASRNELAKDRGGRARRAAAAYTSLPEMKE